MMTRSIRAAKSTSQWERGSQETDEDGKDPEQDGRDEGTAGEPPAWRQGGPQGDRDERGDGWY